VSSKETVLSPLNQENAYKNYYDLPNVNPRCPQLSLELSNVYLTQIVELD
jgi:hypothetical protein